MRIARDKDFLNIAFDIWKSRSTFHPLGEFGAEFWYKMQFSG